MFPDAGSVGFGYACLHNKMDRRGPTVQLPDLYRRRALTAVATLMASAVANPMVRAQARGEESAVAVAVGARTAMSCLPLTLAMQLGYFKA